ncbi:hypothetical protein AB9P05_11025 [Roseivirga sp. BDSF3-8]|uniref:hypothetical protein n=1 Tax=Roseivirga sp. BDSF3-8 TaxID=3241598 RepID=UPI003532155E
MQARYRVEGAYYQPSPKTDDSRTLSVGDTITILYSVKTPQMAEIVELREQP